MIGPDWAPLLVEGQGDFGVVFWRWHVADLLNQLPIAPTRECQLDLAAMVDMQRVVGHPERPTGVDRRPFQASELDSRALTQEAHQTGWWCVMCM